MRTNWDSWLETVRNLIKNVFETVYKIEVEHPDSASDGDPASRARDFIVGLIQDVIAESDGQLPANFLQTFFIPLASFGNAGNRLGTTELMQQEFHDVVQYELGMLWTSAQIDLGKRAWTTVPPDTKELQTLIRHDPRSEEMIKRIAAPLIMDLSRARSTGLPQDPTQQRLKQLFPVLGQLDLVVIQKYVSGDQKHLGERVAAIDIIWNLCKEYLARGTVAKYTHGSVRTW